MSKIQIEQVDSLDEEKKVVRYGDLGINESFIWKNYPESGLHRTTDTGYMQESTGEFPGDEDYEDVEVIPVKAKILWCREGGGE